MTHKFFRSVSVKFGLEVWAEGDSSELFHQKLKEVYYIISYVYFVFQSLNVFKTSFLHFSFHSGRTKISLGKTSSSKFKLKSSTRRWLPWHLLLWLLHPPQLANEEKISRIEMLMDSSGGALPFKGAVSLNRWDFGPFWGVPIFSSMFQQPRCDPLLPGVLGSGPEQRTRTPWTDSAGSQGMFQFGKSVFKNPPYRLEMEEERASENSPSKRGSSLETQPCEWRNNLSTWYFVCRDPELSLLMANLAQVK